MHHFIACYDVSSNRHRTRVERMLKKHGVRVQKSVFEIRISSHDLVRLLKDCRKFIAKGDSLRIYRMCTDCRRATERLTDTKWLTEEIAFVV